MNHKIVISGQQYLEDNSIPMTIWDMFSVGDGRENQQKFLRESLGIVEVFELSTDEYEIVFADKESLTKFIMNQ